MAALKILPSVYLLQMERPGYRERGAAPPKVCARDEDQEEVGGTTA